MPSKVTDHLPNGFGWYAAAAAALGLSIAPAADAQIVYTDVDPDESIIDADRNLDFDNDGDPEMILRESALGTGTFANFEATIGPDDLTGIVGNTAFGYTYFLPLSASAAISAGNNILPARPYFSFTFGGADPNGWLGTDAYIGVEFMIDTGTTHYGWVRVEIPPAGGEIILKEYAFEATPDMPINAGTVPVELTAFNAAVNGSDVLLTWETASETNNAGFEVQMQQGEDWTALGFVEGHGTTTEAQTYSYTAAGMDVGAHTFRLKQIDFDGAFEYSPEVEATVEVVGTHALTNAYPNPFNPQSQFTVAVAREQRVTASLYNLLGQQVATLFEGTVEANSPVLVSIDGAALASGMYLVRLEGETFTDALRVTLAK